MIEVQELSRRFGRHQAVDRVSFQLQTGEVVGLLGPNGAGKTTTMRILAGFLPATSAKKLQVAGLDVLRDSLAVRASIGYLPESVPLYGEMRVEEMLDFHGRLHGMSRADRRRRTGEVLDEVGVLDRAKQLIGCLSRGLKQRVGLAVALMPEPPVLILDEPTSGLDPIQRLEVRGLVRQLAGDHTVLVSSHILAEIESMCSRVLVMTEGQLVADGTREELEQRLGGAGGVRLEAFVGPDPEGAVELLKTLPGVTGVELGERLGIHHQFAIQGEGDLREDVGALASQEGWALRELSSHQNSLEDVFAQLVMGNHAALQQTAPDSPGDTAQAAVSGADGGLAADGGLLQLGQSSSKGPTAKKPSVGSSQPGKKMIYSLNPFDQGTQRELGKPMEIDDPSSDGPAGPA